MSIRKEDIKVFITDHNFGTNKHITVIQYLSDGKMAVMGNDSIWTIVDEGAKIKPTFDIPAIMFPGFAESMIDCLTGESKDARKGRLLATEKHLEDMRAIAFSKIDVDKPENEKR